MSVHFERQILFLPGMPAGNATIDAIGHSHDSGRFNNGWRRNDQINDSRHTAFNHNTLLFNGIY